MLVSAEIKLRTLKDTDLDFLFSLENDKSLWAVSGTTKPFSLLQLARVTRDNNSSNFFIVFT